MHLLGLDQVIVIEDQQHLILTGPRGQLVDQRRDQPLKRWRRGRPQQRPGPFADLRPHPLQRRNHVAPKPRRVVCRPHPPTATPPAGCQTAPSGPAKPSCRTRPGRKPGRAAGPAPDPAPRPAAGGAQTPAAGGARAAWWPAGHPALKRRPPAGRPQAPYPSTTNITSAASEWPASLPGAAGARGMATGQPSNTRPAGWHRSPLSG